MKLLESSTVQMLHFNVSAKAVKSQLHGLDDDCGGCFAHSRVVLPLIALHSIARGGRVSREEAKKKSQMKREYDRENSKNMRLYTCPSVSTKRCSRVAAI